MGTANGYKSTCSSSGRKAERLLNLVSGINFSHSMATDHGVKYKESIKGLQPHCPLYYQSRPVLQRLLRPAESPRNTQAGTSTLQPHSNMLKKRTCLKASFAPSKLPSCARNCNTVSASFFFLLHFLLPFTAVSVLCSPVGSRHSFRSTGTLKSPA